MLVSRHLNVYNDKKRDWCDFTYQTRKQQKKSGRSRISHSKHPQRWWRPRSRNSFPNVLKQLKAVVYNVILVYGLVNRPNMFNISRESVFLWMCFIFSVDQCQDVCKWICRWRCRPLRRSYLDDAHNMLLRSGSIILNALCYATRTELSVLL
jgi:hypothetical protein